LFPSQPARDPVSTTDSPSRSPTANAVIRRGGPTVGSAINILGAVLVIVGFLSPWASCAGQRLTGLEIARQPIPTGQDLGWLYLVPFLAIAALGIALSVIPLAAWRKVPLIFVVFASGVAGLLGGLAGLPALLFFTSLQSAREDLGAPLLRAEYGLGLTALGAVVALAGGLMGAAAALVGALLPARAAAVATSRDPGRWVLAITALAVVLVVVCGLAAIGIGWALLPASAP
jgi:hypothetical protein